MRLIQSKPNPKYVRSIQDLDASQSKENPEPGWLSRQATWEMSKSTSGNPNRQYNLGQRSVTQTVKRKRVG